MRLERQAASLFRMKRCSIFDFCNNIGTKRTWRADLTMSVDGGTSEVGDTQSNRRD